MYQPGLSYELHDHFVLILEYVNWNRIQGQTSKLDHSVNAVLYASF